MTGINQQVGIGCNRCKQLTFLLDGIGERVIGAGEKCREDQQRQDGTMGLPTSPDAVQGRIWTAEALLNHMYKDKKVEDGRITFVLTRGIGQAFLSSGVEPRQVIALLNNALAA